MEVCRKMQGDRIISALIGLVGAMSNNGKTERTDSVVREAFLRLTDGDSEEETVQKIHAEKFAIAPDCANCLNPCGNTSDYDMAQFYAADAKIIAAKRDLIEVICKKIVHRSSFRKQCIRELLIWAMIWSRRLMRRYSRRLCAMI